MSLLLQRSIAQHESGCEVVRHPTDRQQQLLTFEYDDDHLCISRIRRVTADGRLLTM